MVKCKDCRTKERETEINWSETYKCWLCESCFRQRLRLDNKEIIGVI